VAIKYYAEDVSIPKFSKRIVSHWLKDVIHIEKGQCGDITIIFVSDTFLLQMNRDYLNHDYFTDIITFDYSQKLNNRLMVSGDLFISLDTIRSNSLDYNVSFLHELHRVMLHGVLHLLGYKDETSEEFESMKEKEEEYLSLRPTFA
jgi:probable rRNA maturation factor